MNDLNFWRLLQITDSGFPSGGFAHSNGLEAAIQHGEVKDFEGLESFLRNALWQTGHAVLPFANHTHDKLCGLREADELSEIFLTNHIANRASRTQGRTFHSTCEKAFSSEATEFHLMSDHVAHADYHFHYAPLFGAITNSLGLKRDEMQKCLFHLGLRGMLSAAVRLGVLGPYQAQQLQGKLFPALSEIIAHCGNFTLDDVSQTSPLIDLFQGNQDRLYSKLFLS